QDSPALRHVSVTVKGEEQPDQVWLSPLAEPFPDGQYVKHVDFDDQPVRIPTLDGHVLARWEDEVIMISPFSQGGGPASHAGVGPSPITAGSADGNVMLFFYDAEEASNEVEGKTTRENEPDYSYIQVTTTLIHSEIGTYPHEWKAGSYIYALSTTAPLPAELHPTLVLYYERPQVDEDIYGHTPVLHRLRKNDWSHALPTYAPSGEGYAATALTRDNGGYRGGTAPGLYTTGEVEYYRLFWKPAELTPTEKT
ncbi:MAG: hypothetical protein M3220_04985, partial [Chloroflexota bacterium]|nr:hypothetical protein [Chloroflexota bacterium]